ncbi:type II toxin-antitoxin system RelE/ParE family toxin [Aquirufa sp. ROCK2-A2]
MKSGYKILWTDYALRELEITIEYLQSNWTDRELRNLAFEIEETLNLLSHNPNLFQATDSRKDIRRVVIAKHNSLYYRVKNNTIEIISFFSNRQNPNKRKLNS